MSELTTNCQENTCECGVCETDCICICKNECVNNSVENKLDNDCHSDSIHSDSNSNDESDSDSDSELTLDQSLELIQGILLVLSLRLKRNEPDVYNELWSLLKNARYVELLSFLRVLQCHFEKIENAYSESFDQIVQVLDPMVTCEDFKDQPDYLEKSMSGVLLYFKCCFRDDKLDGRDNSLYELFAAAHSDRKYYKMYGMLMATQDQFQKPDKSLVFDIVYENLIALYPELD